MGSEVLNAMMISASGMRTQGTRIRVISENVANANTTGDTPGADPYRRQTISFKNEMDKELGVNRVNVDAIEQDMETPFHLRYDPSHPAANEEGYVKMPNLNPMVELMDVREAQRSYEANLGMIQQSREIMQRTIDLLR